MMAGGNHHCVDRGTVENFLLTRGAGPESKFLCCMPRVRTAGRAGYDHFNATRSLNHRQKRARSEAPCSDETDSNGGGACNWTIRGRKVYPEAGVSVLWIRDQYSKGCFRRFPRNHLIGGGRLR